MPHCAIPTAWLLNRLEPGFTAVHFGTAVASVPAVAVVNIELAGVDAATVALLQQRFDAQPGSTYVLRPDRHICARFRTFDAGLVLRAVEKALHHG
jgi:3-(3-hydroxy-phenyl)propionate hydroxylase